MTSGEKLSATSSPRPRGLAAACTRWIAAATSLFTLLLIVMGGTVTTTRSGDTEPSWSLKFWEWFQPWGTFQGGHFYEMTHRQLGTIVGFLTIALVIFLWRTEKRVWVRRIGYGALGLVILQGLLGGLRVLVVADADIQSTAMQLTGASHAGLLRAAIAMIHATVGPMIFAITTSIAVALSPSWLKKGCVAHTVGVAAIRRLSVITMVLIVGQIILGTFLRHMGWGLAAVLTHAMGAFLVAWYTVMIAFKAGGLDRDCVVLRRLAITMAGLVQFQIFLGVYSYASSVALPIRTLHQVMGSVLLALCLLLVLRAFNLLRPSSPAKA